MKMYIRSTALLITALLVFTFTAQAQTAGKQKPSIMATSAPIQRLLRELVGGRLNVKVMTPATADAHSYAMRAQDFRDASNALMVVMNGADMEITMARGLGLVKVKLNASKGLQLIRSSKMLNNPHVWLDPVMLQGQILTIKNKLVELDPEGAQIYERNHELLLRELEGLDAYASNKLRPHKGKMLITHHDAFAYLAARYELKYLAISSSHHGSPLPGTLREAYKSVKAEKVPAVFSDTTYPSKVLENLADDMKIRFCTLDTLVSGIYMDDFIKAYKKNIDTIAQCLSAAKDGTDAR